MLSSAALISLGAAASPLSPEAALRRVMDSRQLRARVAPAASRAVPELAFTATCGERPTLYLFSRSGADGGFMLLSADDAAAPLLGYADSGSMPADTALWSPEFRYWMSSLSDQVAYAASAGTGYAAPQADYGEPIEPMVKTKWNQTAPYNDDCPKLDGHPTVTGCVATAMAQILKYHGSPARGTGKASFDWRGETLTFDFDADPFEWDLMTDTYGSKSTDAERAAVARLMYACGVSISAYYGVGETGAAEARVPASLVDHFGYDRSVRYAVRDYFTLDEWGRLIYDQLRDYGPVQYSGFLPSGGGHSFVCDGYLDSGFFHFNWGWGGMSDGYFLLTALDPGQTGVGVDGTGFNFSQDIVCNIRPGSDEGEVYPTLYCIGDFKVSPERVLAGKEVSVSGGFFSYTVGTLRDFTPALCLTPESDGAEPVYALGDRRGAYGMLDGFESFRVRTPESLQEGVTYKVTPALRAESGEWYPIRTRIGAGTAYTAVLEDGCVVFAPEAPASAEARDLRLLTPLFEGSSFEASATLTNESEMEYLADGTVALFAPGASRPVAAGTAVELDVPAGSSVDFRYESSFKAVKDSVLRPGDYDMYVCRMTGSDYVPLGAPARVTLRERVDPEFEVVEFDVPDKQETYRFQATAKLKITKGYFHGNLHTDLAEVVPGRDWVSFDHSVNSRTFMMAAPGYLGDDWSDIPSEVTLEFDGAFPASDESHEFIAALFDGDRRISDQRYFSFDTTSGIRTAEADAIPLSTEYFTLTGLPAGTYLPEHPGIYIERLKMSDGSASTRRIAVR